MKTRTNEAAAKLAVENTTIHALLKLIGSELSSCSRETANWGDVGNAVHIRESLEEIAKFLQGGQDEAVQLATVRAKVAIHKSLAELAKAEEDA
jgi:hypothetical protein